MPGVNSGQYNLGFGGIGPNQPNPGYMGAGQYPFGEEEDYKKFGGMRPFNQGMLGAAPNPFPMVSPAGSANYAPPSPVDPRAVSLAPAPGPSPLEGVPAYDGTQSDAYNEATEYGALDPMNPVNFTPTKADAPVKGPKFKKAPSKLRKKGKAALQAYSAIMAATEEPIKHHQFKTMGLLGRM